MLAAIDKALWLGRFLQSLKVVPYVIHLVVIHYDSMYALPYVKSPKYHEKSEHMETCYQYIRDIVAHRKVVLKRISTSLMMIDPLSKPMARDVFQSHAKGRVYVDFSIRYVLHVISLMSYEYHFLLMTYHNDVFLYTFKLCGR